MSYRSHVTHATYATTRWKIIFAFTTLCVVWSSTWLAIKVGLGDLPPISFVAIRFLIAFVVLVAVSAGRVPLLPKNRTDWLLLAFTGVLMFSVNYGLLFWGELHVSSGLAAVLQAMIPVAGMIFAHWLIPAEPLRWQQVGGAALAVSGVALICGRLFDHGGILAFWAGLGIVIGGAGAAFSNVLLKRRALQLAPAMIAAWQMIFGTIPMLLLGLILEGNPLRFHWTPPGPVLPFIPRGHRFGTDVSPALLAVAAHSGEQAPDDFADHATGCGHVWIFDRRGNVLALVIARRGVRSRWGLDDFSQGGSETRAGRR